MTPAVLAGLVLRRLLVVAGIVVAVFALVRLVPGDVVDVLAAEGDIPIYEMEEMRAEFGLDRPVWDQFGAWLAAAAAGDLGESHRFRRPVADLVLGALPATLALAALSLLIGLVMGLATAIWAMLHPPLGALVQGLNVWSTAFPTFCVGLAAILLFAIGLGWMPVLGNWWMPALVVGVDIAGQLAKPLHEDMKEGATAGYVRTARAKGLTPGTIVLRHVLPNALPATLALTGMVLAGLIGGTITMEVLFGLPGLGTLMLQAIQGRDYPLVQAAILVLALGVVGATLLTDVIQRVVDPRAA
jgi:peptide/nickel transport system permease protein